MLMLSVTALAAINFRTGENRQQPTIYKTVADTATTTTTIPVNFTHFLDSEFLVQGACVKIKDVDGIGYTYLSVNDGAGNFSSLSCE